MAERILVSTEDMLATLSTYSSQKNAQSVAFNKMNSAVNSLQGMWEGEAANTFKQQFQKFFANIRLSEDKMQDAVDELRKSSEFFTEAEKTTGTAAGALDVGTSPFTL